MSRNSIQQRVAQIREWIPTLEIHKKKAATKKEERKGYKVNVKNAR